MEVVGVDGSSLQADSQPVRVGGRLTHSLHSSNEPRPLSPATPTTDNLVSPTLVVLIIV